MTGQKVNINGVINAGSLWSVYNGGTGGAYLNFAGPPVPAGNDLQLFSSGGTGTITTGIFGFGGNGIVYVGDTNVGGGLIDWWCVHQFARLVFEYPDQGKS